MKTDEGWGAMPPRGVLRLLLGLALLAAGMGGAQAGELFKCGSTFQDRPCESSAVQQRFSRTQGTFAIQQVHASTDSECARAAAEGMTWWDRMAKGETLEQLHADIQARNIPRQDKSVMRDRVTAVSQHRGGAHEVRGHLEAQCMAARRHPSGGDREMVDAPATRARSVALAEAQLRRAEADARRAEIAATRAEIDARRRAVLQQRDARLLTR